MLKRLLLSAVVLSAVSVSSYAIDVNIPGANPSIAQEAYLQGVYTTDKMKAAYHEKIEKEADSFSVFSKNRFYQEFGVVVDDATVEELKQDIYAIKRRQFDGNTIVNLHNDNGGVSVTLPFSGIQKEAITDFPNSNVHYLIESPMIAAGIIENKTPNTTDKTDVAFKYDGLSKSYLRKTTLSGAVEMDIIGLNFELSKHPNQEYNVILYPRATKLVTSNDINTIMANYIVPSIYSHAEEVSRGLPTTCVVSASKKETAEYLAKNINEKLDEVTFTIDKDINQQIRIEPNYESEKGIFSTVDEIRILNKIDNKSAELFGTPGAKMITKGFHTYVWNDGIPGLLLDFELDNQQGMLMFITYDESHKYVNTIQYPLDNGVYSKAQLRKLITDAILSDTGNMYQEDVWFI